MYGHQHCPTSVFTYVGLLDSARGVLHLEYAGEFTVDIAIGRAEKEEDMQVLPSLVLLHGLSKPVDLSREKRCAVHIGRVVEEGLCLQVHLKHLALLAFWL